MSVGQSLALIVKKVGVEKLIVAAAGAGYDG